MTKDIYNGYLGLGILFRVNNNKEPLCQWRQLTESEPYVENARYAIKPNILIIDVDVKKGSKGLESLARLREDLFLSNELSEPNVITPSGGMHYYYEYIDVTKHQADYEGIDFIGSTAYALIGGNVNVNSFDEEGVKLKGDYILKHMNVTSNLGLEDILTKRHTSNNNNDDFNIVTDVSNIETLLTYVNSEDRDTWIKYGMILKHAGVEFDIFHEWSMEADSYQSEGDCQTRWDSFPANGHLTIATLIFDVKKIKEDLLAKKKLTIDEAKAYPSIVTIDGVNDEAKMMKQLRFDEVRKVRNAPTNRQWFTTYDKKLKDKIEIAGHLLKERYHDGKYKKIESCVHNNSIKIIDDLMYHPQEQDFFKFNNSNYANTFEISTYPKKVQSINPIAQEQIDFVHNHMKVMFGEEEVKHVLAWIGNMLKLKDRNKTLMMWIDTIGGTGKGLLINLIRHIIGTVNFAPFHKQQVLSPFNSWSQGNIFKCDLDYIYGNYRENMEYLGTFKDIIDSDAISVVAKGKEGVLSPITANYLIATNHSDIMALNAGDGNRKWYPVVIADSQDIYDTLLGRGYTKVDFKNYFSKLDSMSKTPYRDEFYTWLTSCVYEEYNPTTRPSEAGVTELRVEAVEDMEINFPLVLQHIYATDKPPYVDLYLLACTIKELYPKYKKVPLKAIRTNLIMPYGFKYLSSRDSKRVAYNPNWHNKPQYKDIELTEDYKTKAIILANSIKTTLEFS